MSSRPHKHNRRLQRARLLITYGNHCIYCGRKLTPKTVTREHIVPKSQGGSSKDIRPACMVCNQLKGHMTLEQFKELAKQAWENRSTIKSKSWRYLFNRFGEVGVLFYYEGEKTYD
jgi:5-methylcytosine-specific restriction endonuclease McrA